MFVLRCNIPVNIFSVMSGQCHRFLCINKFSGELIYLAQGQNTVPPAGDRIQNLSVRSPMFFHYANALSIQNRNHN